MIEFLWNDQIFHTYLHTLQPALLKSINSTRYDRICIFPRHRALRFQRRSGTYCFSFDRCSGRKIDISRAKRGAQSMQFILQHSQACRGPALGKRMEGGCKSWWPIGWWLFLVCAAMQSAQKSPESKYIGCFENVDIFLLAFFCKNFMLWIRYVCLVHSVDDMQYRKLE